MQPRVRRGPPLPPPQPFRLLCPYCRLDFTVTIHSLPPHILCPVCRLAFRVQNSPGFAPCCTQLPEEERASLALPQLPLRLLRAWKLARDRTGLSDAALLEQLMEFPLAGDLDRADLILGAENAIRAVSDLPEEEDEGSAAE